MVVFDGYSGGPSTKDNRHQRRAENRDCDINNENKPTEPCDCRSHENQRMSCNTCWGKCCLGHAVSLSFEKTTMLTGEDIDLLVLLLHYASPNDGIKLYFRSDKGSHTVVYDIKVMKRVLGSKICQSAISACIHRMLHHFHNIWNWKEVCCAKADKRWSSSTNLCKDL